MAHLLELGRFSIGIGDRFSRQAKAQLSACILARQAGVEVTPVWNKSEREHSIIGSTPACARQAADAAVLALGWEKPYHVDADHIRLNTVDHFVPFSDFYTIDVADWIGKPADPAMTAAFIRRHPELTRPVSIPSVTESLELSRGQVETIASQYLRAAREAGEIYRHIAAVKGSANFITEVSIDEADTQQTPSELLVILAALADEGIPLQTIAPKFAGRFNKGVDYFGNVAGFEKEFCDDLAVIAFAAEQYGFPKSLKISVHSGSDKFSIYASINRALAKTNAGLHIKTAGTTWLEELIGLAEAGGDGMVIAKQIYALALDQVEDLLPPYAPVIAINQSLLPSEATVNAWSSEQYVSALRHDQNNKDFNPHFRQLLHIGYKIAARMGKDYLDALEANQAIIARNVTHNLYERHLKPLFLAQANGHESADSIRGNGHRATLAAGALA